MNEINSLLANNIKDIMARKYTSCPKCHVKLSLVQNTYKGIPVLSVQYCKYCGYTPDIKGIE